MKQYSKHKIIVMTMMVSSIFLTMTIPLLIIGLYTSNEFYYSLCVVSGIIGFVGYAIAGILAATEL